MRDESNQFEEKLRGRPLRQTPADWRGQILAAANAAADAPPVSGARRRFLTGLGARISSVLWPHPVAWGALAVAWVFVLTVHFSLREAAPATAAKSAIPSLETMAELRQEHHLLVELIGENDSITVDRPRKAASGPRGERLDLWAA